MSIFRRDTAAPVRPAAASTPPAGEAASLSGRATHVAPGTRIEGQVSGSTELWIEGEIAGTVKVEATVTVGPSGVVHGPITGRLVKVAGKVIGNVRGTDRVEVGPAAVLEGDIAAPRVVIAEGAFFKGMVEMKGEPTKPSRPQQAAETKRES
jgi:cytoskeletal protein CcmA (bactofilin family)